MISVFKTISKPHAFISLMLTGLVNAWASTWVPIGVGDIQIMIPSPSLDGIQLDNFQYGDDAVITLNDFGTIVNTDAKSFKFVCNFCTTNRRKATWEGVKSYFHHRRRRGRRGDIQEYSRSEQLEQMPPF